MAQTALVRASSTSLHIDNTIIWPGSAKKPATKTSLFKSKVDVQAPPTVATPAPPPFAGESWSNHSARNNGTREHGGTGNGGNNAANSHSANGLGGGDHIGSGRSGGGYHY